MDPTNTGIHIHLSLQALLNRKTAPTEIAVPTFGKFQGGNAANIIPTPVLMEGTLRTFSESLRYHLLERIQKMCFHTAQAFQGNAQAEVLRSTCSLNINAAP